MNVLILEDNTERIKWFVDNLDDLHDLTICTTARAAIAALEGSEFNMVFLDHDLGGKTFVLSEDPNTGYQVALHIASMGQTFKVVIHSWNPAGVQKMADALRQHQGQVITKQFGQFDKSIAYA